MFEFLFGSKKTSDKSTFTKDDIFDSDNDSDSESVQVKHVDNGNWDNFVRFGVDLGGEKYKKSNLSYPKNWRNLTKSTSTDSDNIAILTGKVNDIIVVDIDIGSADSFVKHFGSFDKLNTLVTKSWNGGYHVFFKYSFLGNCTRVRGMDIDVHSDDRFVYQGKMYPVVNNSEIRPMTDSESSFFC